MTDQADRMILAGIHPLTAQALDEIVRRHGPESLSDAFSLVAELWTPDAHSELINAARADWFGNPAIDNRYKRILDATAEAMPETLQMEFVPAQYVTTLLDTAKSADWPSDVVRSTVNRLWQKAVEQQADQALLGGDHKLSTTLHGYSLEDLASLYANYEHAGMPESHPFRLLLAHYLDYALLEFENPGTSTDYLIAKGGPGSGNFGHAGRPGEVGGSAPKGAALDRTSKRDEKIYAETLRNVEAGLHGKNDIEKGFIIDPDSGEIVFEKTGIILEGIHQIEFDDDEMELLTDRVFTHNHPAGSSLSESDVHMAIQQNMREVRAVGHAYTYRMIRPANGKWPSWLAVNMAMETANLQVKNQQYRLIGQMEITPDEASHRHWHLVWEKVAPQFGLDYRREKNA